MMFPPSSIEKPEVIAAFREVFCEFFETDHPDITLESCPQWAANLAVDMHCRTRLINGCLLNTSSTVPNSAELRSAMASAAADILQFVVPNVRSYNLSVGIDLAKLGFFPYSAGIEAIVYIGNDWQSHLLNRIGARRLSELRRFVRKAKADFDLETRPLQTLSSAELSRLDPVFEHHEQRYGHKRRLFGDRLLKILAKHPALGPHLNISVRSDRADRIVQAMLWFEHDNEYYYLAQAIHRDLVNSSHNLYKASFSELYERANLRNVQWINLGRGSVEAKHKLGANIIFDQQHWIARRTT